MLECFTLGYKTIAGAQALEESPGSIEQRQSLTATGSNPRESATETTLPKSERAGDGERSAVRAHSAVR